MEDGIEVRPHHYIRSILPKGPVGMNGILCRGDELLEVNGKSLKGLFHEDVVKTLKQLPIQVSIVCGRRKSLGPSPLRGTIVNNVDTGQSKTAFASRKILSGSLQSLLNTTTNVASSSCNMMKAKSEVSLDKIPILSAQKSESSKRWKSLEPLTKDLAMWSSTVEEITLMKGDRGLGFSILDYQDPLNPAETVIVVRSLVPGANLHLYNLVPGDRIVYVNNVNLEHASLDMAVQALKGAPFGHVRIGICKPLLHVKDEQKTLESNVIIFKFWREKIQIFSKLNFLL